MRRTFLEFAPPDLGPEEEEEVVAAMRSRWLTSGPRARRFEEEFAVFVGARAALALNSCSAALHAALFAGNVGPGDAVVTSPMTFASTAHAIEHVGARTVFADVEEDTLNVAAGRVADAADLAATEGLRVRALLPVHFAGQPCDMRALAAVAADRNLALLEDAAHALPARRGGAMVGTPVEGVGASLACFSFYANKNLTTGEGGVLVGDAEAVARARLLANQGLAGNGPAWHRDAVVPGFKFGMSDVAAAIGLRQLTKLVDFHQRRCALAARYASGMRDFHGVEPLAVRRDTQPAWHLYVVRLDLDRITIDRDRVVSELAARNVGASVHFRPLHLHTYFRERYGLRPVDFPVASRAWPRILSLPIHPAMTEADADDVVNALADVLWQYRR